MGEWKTGVNYWDNYSPMVNFMFVIYMPTLIIIIEIHTKPVDFVLSYTKYEVKAEIFMDPSIVFFIEGAYLI